MDCIKIGKDKIVKGKNEWAIRGPSMILIFKTKDEVITFYCENCCNPIYNKFHYDCESCPITLEKENLNA